ncbi:zinc finger, CCHC-type containing protein [Tanacetum coccineum]|uniref:Zinc finger, CCHC-type containing protein n=1 Tax=Tanacetum coccineum TaxID=301880 RepID=A0ABQ4XGD7_9ASTR
MFQQHQGESLSEACTHFKDLLQKVPHHGIDRWLLIQIFYDHVSFHLKCEIDRAAGGKLCDKNIDESWEIIKNLALYDHERWNDSKDFVKPIKAISTPQSTLKTPDRIPQAYAEAVYSNPHLQNQNEPSKQNPFTIHERTSPNPQPQALGTTFKARVRDYMAAHAERMERFENAIFKQREEINDKMAEMFRLLMELTTSRATKKVLIIEEAKSPVTKNINYFSLTIGEEEKKAVLEGGPWLIHKSPIILKKWSMDIRLLKEELTRILIWVKFHDVSIQGRSSFARCLIEYEWRPPRCDICKIFGHVYDYCPKKVVSPPIVTTSSVVTPTVEKTNDGFQMVGKNKKRKGKSKSTNGGQFTGPLVKQNVRYDPKVTTTTPKKRATYVGNTSQSSSMLKTTGNSSKKDNLSMSNYFSALNDEEEEEDDEEAIENVHDKSLTNERPAETDIRLSLASHSYIYPLGIAEDVLVDVAGYIYPVDFVILDIKEDEKRPFILGTPFLTMAKVVIKFDKGTITLRSGKSKISFHRILESLCKFEKRIKNDIEPIAPTMTVNRLVLEWEENIKLH